MAEGLEFIPLKTDPSKLVVEFSELYAHVIAKLYDLKCRKFLSEAKEALKNIRRLKYNVHEEREIRFSVSTDYGKLATRCAYMYSYSILHTSVVYSEFLKQLKRKEEQFSQLFSKSTLKICCLAGGPAFEVVAVAKAINDFIGKFPSEDVILFTDVHVTVVDIFPEWKSEGVAVINALQKYQDLYHSKNVSFHHDFLEVDLLQPFEKNLKDKIKDANIVTVVKLGSAVDENSAKNCRHNLESMIKNVAECMEENSCLFILDSAGGNAFSQLVSAIPKSQGSFGQFLHQEYKLHPKVLQKMEMTMDFRKLANTSTLLPTAVAKVSSYMWKKNPVIVKKEKKTKKSVTKDSKHE